MVNRSERIDNIIIKISIFGLFITTNLFDAALISHQTKN